MKCIQGFWESDHKTKEKCIDTGKVFFCKHFITVYNPTTNEVFLVHLGDFDCQTIIPSVGLTVNSRLCALSHNNTLTVIAFKYVLGSKVYICYILLLKCHFLLFLTAFIQYITTCRKLAFCGKIQTEQQFLKRVSYSILLLYYYLCRSVYTVLFLY